MRALRFILVMLAALATACSSGPIFGYASNFPADGEMDASGPTGPSLDVMAVAIADNGRGGPYDTALGACASNRDCPGGQVCLQGMCAVNTCLDAENPCGTSRCQMECVPARDLCEGVACTSTQTCFQGMCVEGCFPAPCVGLTCPPGQYCNEDTGACKVINPCTAVCHAGYTCNIECLPMTPCDDVTCPANQLCVNGVCQANPCASVTCMAGALCIDGTCTPTCGCDPPCNRSPRDRCVEGHCQCSSLCTSSTPCGTDDGCGGHCMGPCSSPYATCDPVLFSCNCTPVCPPTAPCGTEDGCGGRCDQGCSVGMRCDTVRQECICETICPSADVTAATPCGTLIANICPGGPTCGVGTMCPMGMVCDTTHYTCECPMGCPGGGMDGSAMPPPPMSDAAAGGGGPSPSMDASMDAPCPAGTVNCSGLCVNLQDDNLHCGTCDGPCPTGTHCAGGICECPTPLTLCEDACVNTNGDGNNCGGCGTICAGRSYCDDGVCTCIPACTTDPNSVVCGLPIANACPGAPSCGVGTMCPSGNECNTATGSCVCVPRCPPGVLCGTTDGCGGQCVGVCPTDATCTQDPTNLHHYFCSTEDCVSGCACDEVCTSNHCVTISCPEDAPPCPCQCCPDGYECVGGVTCLEIPM